MQIIRSRVYGEPKLKKPKFCNNKNLLGVVTWSSCGKCKCKLWKHRDKYYLLHKDWFSSSVSKERAKELGIIESYNGKFIYNDNYGGVILRNEALIEFSRKDWVSPTPSMTTNLCLATGKMLGQQPWTFVEYSWEHVYEQCLNLITSNHFDTKTQWIEPSLRSL